jgi:hypothetical protein
MKKYLITIILTLILLTVKTHEVNAIVNPLDYPNNKFGIHIATTDDLLDAADLVNSSGGDWGYVTFVIREDERDKDRWQKVFNKMRQLHLIPIVRIATIQENGGWKKPDIKEVDAWVNFFQSLNWVVKNRYIIVFNEPNHTKEWGGEINANEYATYLKNISIRLKEKSEDYFILPAGFDASASSSASSLDEALYLKQMIQDQHDVFDHIDGWTSHSYPNPDFSGNLSDQGRGSVNTYKWEINLLKSFGVEKQYPIFITETGWAHNGEGDNKKYRSVNEISEIYKEVFNKSWIDNNIVAITPFILNYVDDPFSIFSWKKSDGSFYSFYQTVKDLEKQEGKPKQNNFWIIKNLSQFTRLINDNVTGVSFVKNLGQVKWKKSEYFDYVFDRKMYHITAIFHSEVLPGETSLMFYIISGEN